MKQERIAAASAAVLGFIILLNGCDSHESMNSRKLGLYVTGSEEEYYGTWLSSDATDVDRNHQRLVNHHWGYIEVYHRLEDKNPEANGTYAIIKKYKDQQENTWYVSIERYANNSPGVVRYTLTRISKSGKTYEQVSDVFAVPNEKDLESGNETYGKWHRQE